MELKNEMTWSHRDKPERTLAYLDSDAADRLGIFFVMDIVSQEDDQYLKETTVVELVNEDKGKFSNFRNYDEELEMLED